jgi:hypothetical protein
MDVSTLGVSYLGVVSLCDTRTSSFMCGQYNIISNMIVHAYTYYRTAFSYEERDNNK